MAKVKTSYFCQNCGAQFAQWMGKCSSCNEWNTLVKEVVNKPTSKAWQDESTPRVSTAQPIQKITLNSKQRIDTKDQELNRVLGGGIVAGSLILLGGQPELESQPCYYK